MLFHALIGLTFWGFLSCSASAEDSQCASLLLKNITDGIQSSIVVTLLNNAESLLKEAKKYATKKTKCSAVESGCEKPMDCADVKERNYLARSGIYKIWPRNRNVRYPVEVYCDMEDDGGAWTVLQRRGDFDSANDYFYKDWQSYKIGFGDPERDFWIGNDNIFYLTNQRSIILKFTLTDWEGKQAYATYGEFWIEDEFRNYAMHVSEYKGTAGDCFSYTHGNSFSTKDRDNDEYPEQCALKYRGAWWYKNCSSSNINGLYFKGADRSGTGVYWYRFRQKDSLKDTVMKIRPKRFP